MGPEASGMAGQAFKGSSRLIEIGEHANMRVGGEPRDLENAQKIAARGYETDPTLTTDLKDGLQKYGKTAIVQIGALAEIEEQVWAVGTQRVLDALFQVLCGQVVHIPAHL